MIDVKKTRNNFQKFPSLKQKCNPVTVVKTQNATKTTQQPAATPKSIKSQSNDITNTNTATATATTTTTTKNTTTAAYVKPIICPKASKVKFSTSSSKWQNDPATSLNPAREGNKHFFLVQEYKDKNFLKAECELAHSQVYKPPATVKQATNKTLLPVVVDNRRSINKSPSLNNNSPGTSAALAATVNGMRRTGNGSNLGTTTAVATSINKLDYSGRTQFKGLPSATTTSSAPTSGSNSSSIIRKSTTVSAYSSSKLLSRSTVKPLVHRSGATTSVATVSNSSPASGGVSSSPASASPTQSNNNNNNGSNTSLNSITNSGNNNMQTALDQDDIKFIDSDEQPPSGPLMSERKCEQPRCCFNNSHSIVAKSRVRPKSTILCSTSSAVAAAAASASSSASGNNFF